MECLKYIIQFQSNKFNPLLAFAVIEKISILIGKLLKEWITKIKGIGDISVVLASKSPSHLTKTTTRKKANRQCEKQNLVYKSREENLWADENQCNLSTREYKWTIKRIKWKAQLKLQLSCCCWVLYKLLGRDSINLSAQKKATQDSGSFLFPFWTN